MTPELLEIAHHIECLDQHQATSNRQHRTVNKQRVSDQNLSSLLDRLDKLRCMALLRRAKKMSVSKSQISQQSFGF